MVDTEATTKYTIRIEPDYNSESPREWSNMGRMVLGRRLNEIEGFQPSEDLSDDLNRAAKLLGWRSAKDAVLLKIRGYSHGSTSYKGYEMDAHPTGYPWTCPFDSGWAGFIIAPRSEVLENYSTDKVTAEVREKALSVLHGELETYTQWVNGEVYGYIIEDEDGNKVESCWGFIGEDYCREEAESIVKHLTERT